MTLAMPLGDLFLVLDGISPWFILISLTLAILLRVLLPFTLVFIGLQALLPRPSNFITLQLILWPVFFTFIYTSFNRREFAVFPSRFSSSFDTSCMAATDPIPSPTPTHVICAKRSYNLHRPLENKELTAGSGVYDTGCICPPVTPDIPNLLANTFGIEFDDGSNAWFGL